MTYIATQLEYSLTYNAVVEQLNGLNVMANMRAPSTIDLKVSAKIRDYLEPIKNEMEIALDQIKKMRTSLIEKLSKLFKERTEALAIFCRTFRENPCQGEVYCYSQKFSMMHLFTLSEYRKLLKQDWQEYIQKRLTHYAR